MRGIFIELANPSRSYFAGQVIQGRVTVQTDKPSKVKEVTVLLEGVGRVSWSETQTYTVHQTTTVNGQTRTVPRTQTRVINYSATEKYVSHKISLAGDGHNLTVLPKGASVYEFQLALPTNCPSSFASKTGLVSYFIEAEARRPMLKKNKRMAVPFTVNGIFDLNLEFGATQAQELKKVKGSNFFACRKGQMGFILRLPRRSGFVPGEILDFSSEVTNSSNRKVNGMKATLNQVTQFHAQGRTKVETKVISEVKGPEVEKSDHEMWIPHSMVIPPLPPTRLGGICRIIDVQYFIRFELNISGLSLSLTGELPVMIGTIPLKSTFDELRNHHQPQRPPLPHHPPQGTGMGFHVPVPGSSRSMEPIPGSSKSMEPVPQEYYQEEKSPLPMQESVVPSAPILQEYPDLPPPTYAEAVMSDVFSWNPAENDIGNGNVSKHNEAMTEEPSAPPMNEYIPNYVTYNYSQM